ncbi:MAG TPA: hypothetical protein VFE88_01820 [Candidatus Nanoarchaeia archaeon]|nr:hypothetical protein [Candidatus Nanoarchaeia archaeon]
MSYNVCKIPVIRGERSESATSPSTADHSRGAEAYDAGTSIVIID